MSTMLLQSVISVGELIEHRISRRTRMRFRVQSSRSGVKGGENANEVAEDAVCSEEVDVICSDAKGRFCEPYARRTAAKLDHRPSSRRIQPMLKISKLLR